MGVSVRYARFYPISGLVLGGLSLVLNLWVLLLGGGLTSFCALIPGALFFYFGVTGWKKEYFSYYRGTITVGAILGPITREIPSGRGGTIVVRDGRIRLLRDGKERGAGVAKWASYTPDWDKAVAAIRSETKG
ncbi:hypothetical protein Afil01_52280 [Actinorhabdospora filicis]|uniref:Uncharacterized protein n=1 Tax=Actinorhabdospora filicis TaxID=1785913 RepID=A0A9W6WCB4_9ACTN|nr:hypothetical protein [Actinorhabdospora filicis]GLZ80421.1 hypothetical protein Afil01_52280 [Actinorhabdospora filicis]